jgi:hypothetical protein
VNFHVYQALNFSSRQYIKKVAHKSERFIRTLVQCYSDVDFRRDFLPINVIFEHQPSLTTILTAIMTSMSDAVEVELAIIMTKMVGRSS